MTSGSKPCYSGAGTEDARCFRCEVLPDGILGGGRLYLRMPVAFTAQKTRRLASEAGWMTEEAGDVFVVDVPTDGLSAIAREMREGYTSVERASIRALFVKHGHIPDMRDYLEADSLQKVIARSRLDDVTAVIDGGNLAAAFHPIVDATTLEIFAHEGLIRLPPGSAIAGPGDLFSIARETDTLPNVDLAARRTIISAAAAQSYGKNLFVNFMPSSIYDAATCLRSTIALLDDLGFDHGRIVFEVVESDEIVDVPHLIRTLDAYRAAGFRVALDDLGAGFASLNLLHMLRPDFIKLDLELVRDVDRDAFKGMLAGKLIEAARELGMGVIAEGVERAGEWEWLRDHGATFVQGYLFGRPQSEIRSSVPVPA
jgi:EAL domain-containing protein (putative c-di-GMP-specific phosphodiesterase class I)